MSRDYTAAELQAALDTIRENLHAARVLQAHVDYERTERRRAALQAGAS